MRTFKASMIRRLLLRTDNVACRKQHPAIAIERRPDEWPITELARHIPVPEPTLYSWVKKGRLRSRVVRVGSRQITLVHADAEVITRLRLTRMTPPPWRGVRTPITGGSEPATMAVQGKAAIREES